jgi:outer membrane protein assembly factor BamE (lipoprotein component of BamABCDE complex)
MKRITRSLFVAALCLAAAPLLPTSARAESIRTKVAQEQNMNLPQRGMTMAQVERKFGAPERKLDTRGGDSPRHPPIHRWEYSNYIVYFERNHVIHSVITTPDSGTH